MATNVLTAPKPRKHEKPPEDLGPVELPLGKTVKKWKIISKLGEGGCGSVYLVEDAKTNTQAALKAESNFVAGGSVLKLEVQVLRRLSGRKYVAQLLASGKKERYCYMVMTLFGPSLSRLFKACKKEFSISTQIRLGMQMLYGLKQLHEVGYIHRDLKPANLAIGTSGKEARVVHLLDFGLSREFIIKSNGKVEMRRPRTNTLFRGTVKYCSANSHKRAEQGRPDDLWSMVYVMVEMRGPLPWSHSVDKHEIGRIKKNVPDEKLLAKCDPKMKEITLHLRELTYFTRPDYLRIFAILEDIMTDNKIKYVDLYDWELEKPKPTGGVHHGGGTGSADKFKTTKLRQKISRVLSIDEDISVQKTTEQPNSNRGGDQTQDDDDENAPFIAADFEKNELGF